MKKKEFISAFFLFQLFFLFIATETLAQSASKQINEIKRNEAYLFEEATAATEKEARDMAVVKLAKIIADYMKEKNPEGAEKLDDFKDLAEGAEEIVADRGTQKRVFLYFSKHDIDATAEEATKKETPQTPLAEEPQNDVNSRPATELQSSAENQSKVEPIVEQQVEKKQIAESVAPATNSNKSVSDDSLAEWQKRLINSFLRDGLTLIAAKDLVNTYRIENKVKRYGSKSNPPANARQAFYVIADESGTVIAVLGRDNGGERLNYISGNYENISDYNSYNLIWFTLNN